MATAYCLTSSTTVSSGHVIRGYEAASTAHGQRDGIVIAVGLAVGIGRPCGRTRVDREGCTRIGDAVVRQHRSWTQRGGDVIGTAQHRADVYTAVCRRYVVRSQKIATACSQRVGIIIPVGL